MAQGSTLFYLSAQTHGAFDASSRGLAVRPSSSAQLQKDGSFQLDRGFIDVGRHAAMDNLQSFTLEATVLPTEIAGDRRNILEAQSPAVALLIEPGGKLVGSVHTAQGWQGLDSGATLIAVRTSTRVALRRDASGGMALSINGKVVASKNIPGPIVNVGEAGFKIGSWVDGVRFPFQGKVSEVMVRQGAVDAGFFTDRAAKASRIENAFKAKTGLKRVTVNLIPDHGNSRLQPIKDIMNAAGVQKLSDLQTLRVTTRTVMTAGKLMVAPRRSRVTHVDWGVLATSFAHADAKDRRALLAEQLTNRNSATQLRKLGAVVTPAPAVSSPVLSGSVLSGAIGASLATSGRPTTGLRIPGAALATNPSLRLAAAPIEVGELFQKVQGRVQLRDAAVIERLESANPGAWAQTSKAPLRTLALKTVPLNSAVMIGQEIDLTNIELVVEPNVETLYLIAERLVCGNGASITWRRPGGETPARQDDPDLNGRGWSGRHTPENSRDGFNGDPGRDGAAGLAGANGLRAPRLEIWVKDMSAMPNLDFTGEDGRQGGRGQRGGRGGDGADGRPGERIWFFGWHCTADPGDGGDGGHGGRGGNGGPGGSGGSGGKITIGVLDGTLESTVTNRAFRIKNAGGQRGRGGAGGSGGGGGQGGRSGVGDTCKDARHGHDGAQGQPGASGPDGGALGLDGEVQFFEFSEDEWDALLTRPWITEVSPVQAFPGDRITLRGSRFASGDRAIFGASSLVISINPDESASFNVPLSAVGGITSVHIRRQDGTESNRINLWVKPQLDLFSGALVPGSEVTLTGRAFVAGAAVLVDGQANPGTLEGTTRIKFLMPGTGGAGTAGGSVSLQVRNPDGMVSNPRSASVPRILELPFKFGIHDLTFDNHSVGSPDWGTFEDTYGTAEVWHELLDPVFGHPILTGAFFGFYTYFLNGKDNGGLATGFCTSLASLVADKFWLGHTDQHALTEDGTRKMLTGVHGKLLSRESLIHFHDQGRQGVARVEATVREIEATLLRGCDRQNQPLLFFIPSGAAWDAGYFDKLSDSHCVMPYKFVYPQGHSGPVLAPGGMTTLTNLDGVELHVWDCNHPNDPSCRVCLRMQGGELHYDYKPGASASVKFSTSDGITLGMMTHGSYMLSDHDLPFSGPFGLTTFVLDFLLSPAELQVTDPLGLRSGNFGGQILSEIPDSHPCYLVPKALMLPTQTALTRRIVGTGAGTYTYNSIAPDGASVVLQGVQTQAGEIDTLAMSADGTQIRFTPAADKGFELTLARQVGGQARAFAIRGIGGGPTAEVDITLSPELSLLRVGNRGGARNVEVRALAIDRATNTPLRRQFQGVNLPSQHDLVMAVPDWTTLDASVQTLSFD